jgi:hypothetical protein
MPRLSRLLHREQGYEEQEEEESDIYTLVAFVTRIIPGLH